MHRNRKYGTFLHNSEVSVCGIVEYGDASVENCSFAEVSKREELTWGRASDALQ